MLSIPERQIICWIDCGDMWESVGRSMEQTGGSTSIKRASHNVLVSLRQTLYDIDFFRYGLPCKGVYIHDVLRRTTFDENRHLLILEFACPSSLLTQTRTPSRSSPLMAIDHQVSRAFKPFMRRKQYVTLQRQPRRPEEHPRTL